eukprot:TRINITY_DN29019_c0_g1_i1.p1 TRINITY_DN29019_c0_g1~~TRINITY_DN29019_c0_g1_i1.p1  ORF type:complete len:244 (-),score=16.94 TRINITY_DN29019_c0_g1_i1:106-792(-)
MPRDSIRRSTTSSRSIGGRSVSDKIPTSYGTVGTEQRRLSDGHNNVFGVQHVKGGGSMRLMYCAVASLVIVCIRAAGEVATGIYIESDNKLFIMSLGAFDVSLAGCGFGFTLVGIRFSSKSTLLFSSSLLMLSGWFSLTWLAVVLKLIWDAWAICEAGEKYCVGEYRKLNDYGVVLVASGFGLVVPAVICQFSATYFGCTYGAYVHNFEPATGQQEGDFSAEDDASAA